MDNNDKPDPSAERNEAPEPARPDPSSGSKPENAPEQEDSRPPKALETPIEKTRKPHKFVDKWREVEVHNQFNSLLNLATVVLILCGFVLSFIQYELQRKSYLIQNRAYIAMDKVSYTVVPGKNTIVRYSVKNVGKTVAKALVFSGDIILSPRPAGATEDAWEEASQRLRDEDKHLGSFPIIPLAADTSHSEGIEQDDPPLTQAQINLIRADKLRIYAFGKVFYKDFEGNSRRTEFCSYVEASLEGEESTTFHPGFCPKGNTLD